MKRRFFAVLLVLVVGITLAGCGDSTDANPAPMMTLPNAAYATDTPAPSYTPEETPTTTVDPDTGLIYDEVGRPPENAIVDIDPTPEPEVTEISGIVGLKVSSACAAEVFILDPDTGATSQIAFFNTAWVSNEAYSCSISNSYSYAANYKSLFTSDYSKMAVVYTNRSTYEMHCGWIDCKGNFVDVSGKLGMHQTDVFAGTVLCMPVGFKDDNTFIFCSFTAKNAIPTFYGVDLDNITPGAEWEYDVDAAPYIVDFSLRNGYESTPCLPTFWIDETHYYGDYGSPAVTAVHDCRIVDIETGEVTQFLPETTRSTWSAMPSPDGARLAMASQVSYEHSAVEFLIMDLNTLSANVVYTSDFKMSDSGRIGRSIADGWTSYTIIDWR